MWSADPWTGASYFWVVICKNAKAPNSENVMVGHKVPLAETDAYEPLPVTGAFLVQCDAYGEEFLYEPSEVVRLEMEPSENFKTHPRFTSTKTCGIREVQGGGLRVAVHTGEE
jgi:hypothetical protein